MATGSGSYTFAYDPLGRRKQFSDGVSTKDFFYDGLNLLSDGTTSYLNGAGLDEPLQMTASSNTYSYLQDHLGSTTRLVNASSGTLVGRYFYTSYGKLDNQSNPVAANALTYTGREEDGTSLMHYRARYYDPSLEVFISEDPLGDAQRYVGGNPLSFIDPLGLVRRSENGPQSLEGTGSGGVGGGNWSFPTARSIPVQGYTRFVPCQPESFGQPYGTRGTIDLKPTIDQINAGTLKARPYYNKEGILPQQPKGYYNEYRVSHPDSTLQKPGPMRIIQGAGGEMYFSPNHLQSGPIRITP